MNTIKFLLVSLLVSALVVLVANLSGVQFATLVGNLLYVPIAGTFVVVTLFVTLEAQKENQFFLFLLTASYPILDALILVPSIIGITLFLKGEINLLWSLISIGTLSVALADIGFFVTQYNFTYYTGHPIEIFFYWSFIFYIFGVYAHLKIFRVQEKKD